MSEIEQDVVEKMKVGSVDAFSEMVQVYQSRVRAFIGSFLRNPDVVDDLAQETFIQAFKTIGQYQAGASFCSWLFGIGRNLSLNHCRKEKNRRQREQKWWSETDELDMSLCDAAVPERAEEKVKALTECVSQLPKTSAQLVRGFYYEGLSGDTLAESLHMTANAVRQRLARIREALRNCVTAKMEAGAR